MPALRTFSQMRSMNAPENTIACLTLETAMSELGVPQTVQEITADWVNAVVGGGDGRPRVVDLKTTVIGDEKGFLSQTLRVDAAYDSRPGDLPRSIVVKMEPKSGAFRDAAQAVNAFEREIRFYLEVAPSLSVRLPRIYFAKTTPEASVLAMEDLGHLKGIDQVRGIEHGRTLAAVHAIAKVHARYWNSDALSRLAWLPDHDHFFDDGFAAHWPAFAEAYGLRIGTEAVRIGERVAKNLGAIEARIAARPAALIHGDLRADNLLFGEPGTPDEVLILDWQLTTRSLATIDVARLLGGSEPEAERRGRQLDVFSTWYETLCSAGVEGYERDEALEDFRLGVLYCLFIPVKAFHLTGGNAGGRTGRLMDAIAQRLFDSALELEAERALR